LDVADTTTTTTGVVAAAEKQPRQTRTIDHEEEEEKDAVVEATRFLEAATSDGSTAFCWAAWPKGTISSISYKI
jgi:hypothetical protein